MAKFGRILCLTRKWRHKCRDWVVFVVKTKMADTQLVLRVRTTAGTRRNNG